MLKKAVMLQNQIGNIQFILVGMEALEIFYDTTKKLSKSYNKMKLIKNDAKNQKTAVGTFS